MNKQSQRAFITGCLTGLILGGVLWAPLHRARARRKVRDEVTGMSCQLGEKMEGLQTSIESLSGELTERKTLAEPAD